MSKLGRWLLIAQVLFAVVSIASIKRGANLVRELRQQNVVLTADLEAMTIQYELTDEAYQALIATQAQIAEKHRPAVRRVQSAPQSDDAPLAPVLRRALEDLQQ